MIQSPVNWDETPLINNSRVLVGMVIRTKASKGLKNIIVFTFFTNLSIGFRKKRLYSRGRKLEKLF